MTTEEKLKILQMMYTALQAQTAAHYTCHGILDTVAETQKASRQGAIICQRMGITDPRQVFTTLSGIFECADWTVTDTPEGFSATCHSCMLCGMAKKIGSQSPCHLYCLDPMEDMVRALDADALFDVIETLYDGECCRVAVKPGK